MEQFFKFFIYFSIAIITISCNHNNKDKSLTSEHSSLPSILLNEDTKDLMHRLNYDVVNDSLDIQLFKSSIEKYRPLYSKSEEAYLWLCDTFCLNKYSTADEYARLSSFLLFNRNSALSETLSWKLSVTFAVFPSKFAVLDTYAQNLHQEDYTNLWQNLYDYIDGYYYIHYSESKKKRRRILKRYYPYLIKEKTR